MSATKPLWPGTGLDPYGLLVMSAVHRENLAFVKDGQIVWRRNAPDVLGQYIRDATHTRPVDEDLLEYDALPETVPSRGAGGHSPEELRNLDERLNDDTSRRRRHRGNERA